MSNRMTAQTTRRMPAHKDEHLNDNRSQKSRSTTYKMNNSTTQHEQQENDERGECQDTTRSERMKMKEWQFVALGTQKMDSQERIQMTISIFSLSSSVNQFCFFYHLASNSSYSWTDLFQEITKLDSVAGARLELLAVWPAHNTKRNVIHTSNQNNMKTECDGNKHKEEAR